MEDGRQRALDVITTAFANGKLSLEDYETKAGKIQQAKSLADIDYETAGFPQREMPRQTLPGNAPSGRSYPQPRFRQAPAPMPTDLMVEERNGSPEFSLCVMGERRLTGDWLNSDSATSVTLMGSTVLDLRDTALPPGRLKIEAFAVMGEVKVIVPRGVPVKMSAFPFMGEAHASREISQRVTDRSSPWIEVSGIALMGSIIVKSE
jgi:hypothetical protein